MMSSTRCTQTECRRYYAVLANRFIIRFNLVYMRRPTANQQTIANWLDHVHYFQYSLIAFIMHNKCAFFSILRVHVPCWALNNYRWVKQEVISDQCGSLEANFIKLLWRLVCLFPSSLSIFYHFGSNKCHYDANK